MEKVKLNAMDQLADSGRLKGLIYKRRLLNPKRLKGASAILASFGIYSYMPYIAVTLGSTIPVVAACAAGIYGMLSFAESQCVNSIEVIKGKENAGKLRINIAQSAFTSMNIIADVKDVRSIVSLANDDLGEDNLDGNVITVDSYYIEPNGPAVNDELTLTLPGDAFRDRTYLSWILAEKGGETQTTEDFNDLIHQQH